MGKYSFNGIVNFADVYKSKSSVTTIDEASTTIDEASYVNN